METPHPDEPHITTSSTSRRPSSRTRRLATGALGLAIVAGSAVTFNAVTSASASPNPPTTTAATSTTVHQTPTTAQDNPTTTEANPTPGPNDLDQDRIAEEEGWATIPLNDPYLDPDKVVAELRAAGIPVRVALDETEPRPDHDAEWAAAHPEAYSSRTATEAGEDWQRGEDIPPNTITWIDILVADPHHPPAGETGPSPDGTNEDHTAILLPPGQGQDVIVFVSK